MDFELGVTCEEEEGGVWIEEWEKRPGALREEAFRVSGSSGNSEPETQNRDLGAASVDRTGEPRS